MLATVRNIIWVGIAVLIWGLGCYGAIKIFHSHPVPVILLSFFIILFLFACFVVGKMHWDIGQERKNLEKSLLTVNDNDPETFLEAIEFYSTLNHRDNARTDIARAREIGKSFVKKILSDGERNFLSDYQMIKLIVLLGRLDMEEEALQCLQYYYDRKGICSII